MQVEDTDTDTEYYVILHVPSNTIDRGGKQSTTTAEILHFGLRPLGNEFCLGRNLVLGDSSTKNVSDLDFWTDLAPKSRVM